MSIGPWQIIIILAIVLLFFGPKRLPGLAKSLGESIKGFKSSLSGDDDEDTRDVTDSASEQLKESSTAKSSTKTTEKEKV